MGKCKGAYRVLVRKPDGINHLEDPSIDGGIILIWTLKKLDGAWTKSIWLTMGTGGGLL
jgi:hypothetical protein